ncbi:hypothetical protein WH47_00630 [Habropoda laboriosa]|uniref:Uncharacterized protein n=1 Tax=Habropoda laboriosa TaxID=597456 RepID=A0A0L7RI01_9HYME|nr:hypothetical protein WH47_00630 [Habropoda laboriosa]
MSGMATTEVTHAKRKWTYGDVTKSKEQTSELCKVGILNLRLLQAELGGVSHFGFYDAGKHHQEVKGLNEVCTFCNEPYANSKFKEITITLLCVLLIGHNVHAVVNKAQPQVSVNKDEEKPKNGVQADDRISNSYGPPADDYGPPIGSSIKGPAPVYGPPELVGDQGPTPIYPPPPPDVPPPVYGPPLSSYGPPRNIKPLHGPPKQSFGPPLSPLPLKLSFGPLKLHYGPPKQHYGPPYSFGSFRPPKPQYGPPLKFTSAVSNQYIASGASNHGPTKPTHGPVIPVSLDTYGPPPQKLVVQLNSQASDNYGPPLPLSISPLPEAQYGPPTGDLFRLPSPVPPPGVPAPPTPPDIKYDGWQPIAGLSNQHRQPGINYGPPHEEQKIFDVSSVGLHLGQQVTRPVVENPNVPSDSYGTPIHHPEAQDLKSSVNSDANGDRGLPPPPLPEYEPFHNESPPKKEAHKETVTGQVNLQYEVPNVAPLSIVKTIGFELPPTTPSLTTDLSVGSLASLKLPLLSSESHVNFGDTHALQNLGNDLSLSQLSGNTLPSSYGSPLSSVSFVKLNNIESGIPLPPPPVLDSYSSPPLSNREPVKFKETIPSGLYTAFNRYLPPPRHFELTKSPKTYLPPLSLEQQLPIVNVPIAFNKLPSASLNSPIAAPNAQYGTPLSFGDFNTPAPVLTYGAPNFGPASSFISTSTGIGNNLYNSIGNAITTTYGTPVVNLPLSTGGGHDCGFQQTAAGAHYSFEDTGSHAAAVGSHGPNTLGGLGFSQPVSQLSLQNYDQPKANLKDSYGTPPAALPKESFSSGFAQAKNLGSNELDTSQFLNAHGGNEFLTLAKGLSGNDADGFEIQGSKGTYTLKIQPADGGLGTENSDGSIRHDQVLSNGLLQDILAAIEQPEQGQVQLQGHPEAQSLQHVYSDLPQAESINVPKGHYITLDEDSRVKNVDDLVGHASDRSEAEFNKGELAKKETVALFFNNQYDDSRKETRSVTKVENVPSVSLDDGKNVSQAKSS